MTAPLPSATPDSGATRRLLLLLGEISSNFVVLPTDQMDSSIEETQRLIVESLGLDRSTLWQFEDDRAGLVLTHYWQKPEWPALPPHFDATRNLPWAHGKVMKGEIFHFNRLDDLPPEAAADVEVFRIHGPKSNVTIPLVSNGAVFGALAFASLTEERDWSRDEIDGLQLVARIIGNVIGRQRAERRAEELRRELALASRATTLGGLAAALAHEINQPLTSILGNAQAARRFIASDGIDAAEIIAILDDIIRDNKRASGVILNLRVLLEGASPARETCSLDGLVAEVCGFLEGGLSRENIRLRRKPSGTHVLIRAVRVEIQQVLVNLILNATQSMGDTPPERRTILIESSTSGSEALVQVTDHGCGFPPDQLARLFDPFHSTRPGGLGMGLAICRRVITAHGGSIRACNHEFGGAVFSFSLPIQVPAGADG